MLVRKCVLLVAAVLMIGLVAGCGGGDGDGGGGSGSTDFASVKVESSRLEDDSFLVLAMEIENLSDANLYIESTSPTNEEGEKHLWFIIKDGEGNEYASSYYGDIAGNIFPMSVSPRTVTSGELAFDVTGASGDLTLEVSQSETGDGGTRVIYTEDVSP
ncbi:MAG: hypothetical protein JW854_15565 [Actinobacteria bacterium]|nr:hypothetical protein [Actinomycetota bacterium]